MTDITEVIARVRIDRHDAERHGYLCTEVGHDDLAALIDAAEAGIAARDAALEEAATVCDDAASMAPSTEYGGGFTDGVTWAAANIRALRSPK